MTYLIEGSIRLPGCSVPMSAVAVRHCNMPNAKYAICVCVREVPRAARMRRLPGNLLRVKVDALIPHDHAAGV